MLQVVFHALNKVVIGYFSLRLPVGVLVICGSTISYSILLLDTIVYYSSL